LRKPLLVHVTTTDMSLALLLGPQLSAFAAAGYDVVGVSAAGPFVAELDRAGIRHIALRHATRSVSPLDDVRAASELFRLLRRLRPDIVHTHTPKPGIYGRLGGRAAHVPVVVNTVHGLYATAEDSVVRRAVVYAVERLAATCSDAELVQNEEDLSTLAALHVPPDRLHLLGNGIDLDRFALGPASEAARGRVRSELGVDDTTIVVGAVGRLVWEKGYREVFAAAEQLQRRCPDVRLVVAGPSEPEKGDGIGQSAIAAAQSSGVRFLGQRRDVEDLYAACDIYVLASYREGFPRSAMEAAAMGLPVVASDIRGCRQVVEHEVTGLLVPARNAAAIADAVAKLAGDPDLRATMGRQASAKAKRDFDQRRVIAATLAVYEGLLERKRRRNSTPR
jgi:glycosyltransferase involved in cell wall biosynthesis